MQLPTGKRLWAFIGALLAAIVTIAGISFAVFMSAGAGNRLPNVPLSSTVLAFQKMDEAAWNKVKPVLAGVPLPSPLPKDGVVIRLQNGSQEIISVDEMKRAHGSDAALALLNPKDSINSSPLVKTASEEMSWVIVNRDLLPLGTPLTRIDVEPNQISFSWVGPQMNGRSETATSIFELNDFVFIRDAIEVWPSLTESLTDTQKLLQKSLLVTAAKKAFGNGISPEHELLPLFSDALGIWRADSGVLLWGHGERSASKEVITDLHAHASEGAVGTKRIQAQTKEGFAVDVLESDNEVLETIHRSERGWDIVESGSSSQPFITATREGDIVITNSKSLLDGALQSSAPEQTTSSRLAFGLVNTKSVAAVRPLIAPKLYEKLTAFMTPDRRLSFQLFAKGGIWTLTLQ